MEKREWMKETEKGARTQGAPGGELGVWREKRGERGDQPGGRWKRLRKWLFAGWDTGGRCALAAGWGGGAGTTECAPGELPAPLNDPAGRVGESPARAVCPGTAQEMRTCLQTWLEERDELNWEARPGRLGHWCARVCTGQWGGSSWDLERLGEDLELPSPGSKLKCLDTWTWMHLRMGRLLMSISPDRSASLPVSGAS